MRRNNRRNSSNKRERIIMLASSAFVLAALTMTGLYMKGQEIREQDDGYILDFTALENNTDDKWDEVVQNEQEAEQDTEVAQGLAEDPTVNLEDDLDYMPLEAGSGQVEIPGLTDGIKEAETIPHKKPAVKQENTEVQPEADLQAQEEWQEPIVENAPQPVLARELHFSEENKLLRPVGGNVLIPYSMDGSVYFSTLQQYKYNPATIYGVPEGTEVFACSAGKVVSIFDDSEIGHAVTIELGDGYRVTYGQLTDIQVREEAYVETGDKIGTVAAPTKYYVAEGANLYFRMEKDGQPINPEGLY